MVKLVIGMGEIGSAVYELIKKNTDYEVCGIDDDESKCRGKIKDDVDIMHICFPVMKNGDIRYFSYIKLEIIFTWFDTNIFEIIFITQLR